MLRILLPFCFVGALLAQHSGPAPTPTREFEIRADRAFLGGEPIEIWGVRCGNALHSAAVAERHVRAFDSWNEHGINAIGVYIQGSNGGYPNVDAGLNGFDRDGSLQPAVAQRLEWLVREADPLQQPVDRPIALQQDHPGEGAHEDRDPEGSIPPDDDWGSQLFG